MTSAVHLLQYLPPISSTMTPKQRLKPSKPAHNTKLESRRACSSPCLTASSSTTSGRRKGPDDYHATLKALNSKGRFPRKSLGQHYMLNSEINEQLSSAADVGDGDVVLEIGPGTGSLTNVLFSAGAYVIAIEKDPHMAALVSERFADTDRLKVLNEDFLKCHIRSHVLSVLESNKSSDLNSGYAKVVANIPFNISTDIVKQLLPMGDIISEVVLLLQALIAVSSLTDLSALVSWSHNS
ncbi:Ribosomal RNA small subunit methyltransferase A [Morus notabilis]|uniref:rRNA adenine N(6)-methyltransferase n=1 Tax=Morus notabilis TaxID=981085 RepID=W9QP12_9ROSA|nr:Ribosomal RNA small subunit methyltransferase A [Morus notabilis]